MFSKMNPFGLNIGFDPVLANANWTPAKEASVAIDELPLGAVIEIETINHTYLVENCGNGKVLISGHPSYCPVPVLVDFHGATDGGDVIKFWVIERGMHMEFVHPALGLIRTSKVREIRERAKIPRAA